MKFFLCQFFFKFLQNLMQIEPKTYRGYVIKILFLFYFLLIWNEYYTKIMNIIDNTLVPFHSIPFHSIPFHSIPFHSITLHYITLHYITLHYIYIAPVPRDSQARYLKYTLCFIEIYTTSNVMTCLTLVNIRVDKQFENDYYLRNRYTSLCFCTTSVSLCPIGSPKKYQV